jgi:hypothetical protein
MRCQQDNDGLPRGAAVGQRTGSAAVTPSAPGPVCPSGIADAAGVVGVQVGETLVMETAVASRAWLAAHHATAAEIWLVTFRHSSGRRSLAHAAAKDEALCFGWVDGPSTTIEQDAFATRWAPRTVSRRWSALDLARARRLVESGRMTRAGIASLPPSLRGEFGLRPGRLG